MFSVNMAVAQANGPVMAQVKADLEEEMRLAQKSQILVVPLEEGRKVREKKELVSKDTTGLMHFGLSLDDAKAELKDIKFIIVGGTEDRMEHIAKLLAPRLEAEVKQLCKSRFVMYKVGDVLLANHGMGCPSISICINEIILGLAAAGNCQDIRMFRVGTTGGLGVPAGGVIVSTECLNEDLAPYYEVSYMGKKEQYSTVLDPSLVSELSAFDGVVLGKTMTANCFYDNQGRLDGPFATHTAEEKFNFLKKLQSQGVKNIEMEGTCFAALAKRAGIRAAMVCMALVNRLEGDFPDENLPANRAIEVVCDYIANSASKASPVETN